MVPERSPTKDLWQQLLGVAVVFAVIALLISNAQAAPLVDDSELSDFEWTMALTSDTTAGGAFPFGSQLLFGGNTDAYRHIDHFYEGPGGFNAAHWNHAQAYFPFIDGALTALDFSFDANFFNAPGVGGSPPGAVALRAFIFQAGNFYQAGYELITSNVWTSIAFAGLTAADFVLAFGAGPANPDFSAGGAAMAFGFVAGNGSCCGGFNFVSFGVDNFVVSEAATGLPGPASALLLGLGITLAVARRRA